MSVEPLSKRWRALIQASNLDPDKAWPYHQALLAAYQEAHRHYHTLTHLAQMFAIFDRLALWHPALEWATWYHDARYEPGACGNEQGSALMATKALTRLGVAARLVHQVEQLILASQTHTSNSTERVVQLFLDADLSILGASPTEYRHYTRAIRAEHAYLPESAYRQGRASFLQGMLNRTALFLSPEFGLAYEAQARINMAEELKHLAEMDY